MKRDSLDYSIFSREILDDNNNKFEDKIVRHLTGDVESIAIPNANNHTTYTTTSSMDSYNSMKYDSDHEERPWSPDPFISSSPSSLSLDSCVLVSPSECCYINMPK